MPIRRGGAGRVVVRPGSLQVLAGAAVGQGLGSGNLSVGSGADAAWLARANAAGVILANRLDTSAFLAPNASNGVDATHWLLGDATADHVTFDPTVFPTGSSGSWKFTVQPGDGAASGNVGVYFGNVKTFGPGDVYWASFRKRASPQQAYQPRVDSGGTPTFAKMSINSWSGSSSMPNETVIVGIYGSNNIAGYHQNGSGGFVGEEIGLATAANNNDVMSQPSRDRGANPLTGVNPDTGAAWSTWEQQRGRYGILYSARSNPRAENWREGYGDPWSGGIREVPNEWLTYTSRVEIGTNWANSRYTLWVARDGQPYQMVFDSRGITLGNSINYNVLWLLVYYTGGVAGGRQVSARANAITGATIHVVGNATPVGDGTLEYNASTQRFRWKGAGEAFGTARGFSAANGFLTMNVTSGGAANSFVVVEVNPASLPASGVVTDTVTIADNRPAAAAWYSDVIVSTQSIKAPGGYAPSGVSALADLAASMSVGTWANLSVANQSALLGVGNAQDTNTMLPFQNSVNWNPISNRIELVGVDHGPFPTSRIVEYDLLNNTFVLINDGLVDSGTGAGHTYDHTAIDPVTGDAYIKQYGGSAFQIVVRKRNFGDTSYTSTLPFPMAQSTSATYGACWWSGTFTRPASAIGAFEQRSGGAAAGSHGLFVHFNAGYAPGNGDDGVLNFWDPTLNAGAGGWLWSTTAVCPGTGLGNGNWYNTVCKYSAPKNCIVYGGGQLGNQMWRMSSTGVVTKMPNFPGRDVGIQAGNFVCDPVSGDFLVFGNSQLWALDTSANSGAGAWTLQTGSRVPPGDLGDPGGLATESTVSCAMPAQGVVAYIWQQKGGIGAAGAGRFYLYKHA